MSETFWNVLGGIGWCVGFTIYVSIPMFIAAWQDAVAERDRSGRS